MIEWNNCFKWLFILLLLLATIEISGQTRQELESQRKQLEEQIRTTKSLLDESVRAQKSTVEDYVALQNQLRNRRSILRNIQGQMQMLNDTLVIIRDSMAVIETEFNELKEVYFRQLRVSYVRELTTREWMYLLASGSLNEALKRHLYNRQFRTFMNNRKSQLDSLAEELNHQEDRLEKTLLEVEELRVQERRSVNELNSDLARIDQMVGELKGRERELRENLRSQEQNRRELSRKIDKLIAEEMARAEEAEEMLPERRAEYERLSGDFKQNKGQLPWPVDRGIIQSRFGNQPHPTLGNVTINNNGIDIRTQEGAPVRAVFAGEVSAIVSMPGGQHMVLVRHGNYFTVYAGLNSVYVSKGSELSAGNEIGEVGRDPGSGNHTVHFELWSGMDVLNPEEWLNQ